jgi:hypothetical protein
LTIRERIEELNKRGRLEVTLAEDLEGQPTAFSLPGRGRAAGAKPPRPTAEDQEDS